MPNSYENSGLGMNQVSMPPIGMQNIQINKMGINKNSQPEMNMDLDMNGPQSEREL
jgi:hypothetical protein